jgi:hypothetical protein
VLATLVLLAQLAAPTERRPVLAMPEAGLDDSAAYGAYQTRFYRDAVGNTVQIYTDGREGRVVHVLADSDNESIGLSARDARGAMARLRWDSESARVSLDGRRRVLEYGLLAERATLRLGWFLLGSMRVERDFQYWRKHRAPLDGPQFELEEDRRLRQALASLEPAVRAQHLAAFGAPDLATLRTRMQPTLGLAAGGAATGAVVRLTQPSLDGRDTLTLDIVVDTQRVWVSVRGRVVTLRARRGATVPFRLRIGTTARPLPPPPLERGEIFTPEFLRFLDGRAAQAAAPGAGAEVRSQARWLERQVRAVELLASREKLMAGLPTYGTYFGRDMLLTALMMQSIWRPEMLEFSIASALRKLSPRGEVSHEEALGGQAVREAAAEYATLVERALGARRRGGNAQADSLLTRALAVARTARRPREAYHMIDDEFQLPVLVARWLGDPRVSDERKRAFLRDSSDGGGTRLARLVAALGVVATAAAPYAADPRVANLVSFPPRGSGWAAASWRDSNVGYAGGRYGMDVNAIWVPHALDGIARVLDELGHSPPLGQSLDSLARTLPTLAQDTPLGRWARDRTALRAAIDTWLGAERHFVVSLSASDARRRIDARLAALPVTERAYWRGRLAAVPNDADSSRFLAIALDARGAPLPVLNTDPVTRLFLGELPGEREGDARALRDVRTLTRPFPLGLLIDSVGPAVASDAFAGPAVWAAFERDRYHGPRVVWGREVNLFLAGAAQRLLALGDTVGARSVQSPLAQDLREAIRIVTRAVDASGFHNELWSYEVTGGRPRAVRYGSGGDIQLWSTTNLAVQFLLSRLRITD